MSRLRMLAATAAVAATALITAAGVSARHPRSTPAATAATSGGVKTAYFTQWGDLRATPSTRRT